MAFPCLFKATILNSQVINVKTLDLLIHIQFDSKPLGNIFAVHVTRGLQVTVSPRNSLYLQAVLTQKNLHSTGPKSVFLKNGGKKMILPEN